MEFQVKFKAHHWNEVAYIVRIAVQQLRRFLFPLKGNVVFVHTSNKVEATLLLIHATL